MQIVYKYQMFIGKNKYINMLSAENVQSANNQFSVDDIF